MNRLLAATLLAAALACKTGESTETSVPSASCTAADGACRVNSQCCTYACLNGFCARNSVQGGICRTSDDCDWTMTCLHYKCTTGAVCRNDNDVCSYDNECCSGNCTPSFVCLPNTAPTVSLGANRAIAFWAPYTLTATVTDPDVGDTHWYQWTLTAAPPGNTVAPSTNTYNSASLSFFPNVPGNYAFTVTVTDGTTGQRNRLTGTANVILQAVNDPPVVCAESDVTCVAGTPPATTTQSRNVLATLTGSVHDPTVGDATHPPPNVTCAWYATPPGGTESSVATFPSCPANPAYAFTPPIDLSSEGDWTFRLEASDGLTTVSDTRIVTVVNDAPVAEAGPARAVNLATGDLPGPTVSATATQTDRNGDTSFTYAWTFDPAAPGSARTNADLSGANTATVTFTPDVLGTYTLRVTICDRPGSCGSDTVTVDALKHVEDLGHPVSDAEWSAGSIFTVGADPANAGKGKLWIYSGATLSASYALDSIPRCVGVDPTGKMAVMGDDVWVRWIDLNVATPLPEAIGATFAVGDVAVSSTRHAVVFPATGSSYLRILDTSSKALDGTMYYGRWGTVDPNPLSATYGRLFVYDQYWSRLTEYTVQNPGTLNYVASNTSYSCTGPLWASTTGTHLVNGCAGVYSTALSFVKTLSGATALQHAHTASTSGELVALAPSSSTLLLYDSSFNPATTATQALPVWGFAGTPYPVTGKFAFVSADGATRWVIVEANGHTGIVKFP